MTTNHTSKLRIIGQRMMDFVTGFRSVNIASAQSNGIPEASYAPFIWHDKTLYVYLSELAKHCNNLQTNPHVSLLFIESENDCETIFARKRVTWQCQVKIIPRKSNEWHDILDLFEQRHGQTASIIRQLQDFHLFACTPQQASFVEGFAKAHNFNQKQLLENL